MLRRVLATAVALPLAIACIPGGYDSRETIIEKNSEIAGGYDVKMEDYETQYLIRIGKMEGSENDMFAGPAIMARDFGKDARPEDVRMMLTPPGDPIEKYFSIPEIGRIIRKLAAKHWDVQIPDYNQEAPEEA
jgi:hypothetical protein